MASRHTVEGKAAIGPIFTQHANERRLVFRDALPAYDIHAIAKGGERMGSRQFRKKRQSGCRAIQALRTSPCGQHSTELSAHAFVEKRLRNAEELASLHPAAPFAETPRLSACPETGCRGKLSSRMAAA
ncbi:MAG: hypothetical protein ACLT98_13515 [Eggerthellaceae bacterium]